MQSAQSLINARYSFDFSISLVLARASEDTAILDLIVFIVASMAASSTFESCFWTFLKVANVRRYFEFGPLSRKFEKVIWHILLALGPK